MKLLKDILFKVSIKQVIGSTNIAITTITFDSREVKKDSCFVAINGVSVNGHQYIDLAISNGAKVIVCEVLPENIVEDISYVKVSDSSKALGFMASNYYDNPSEKIKLIGVTGTNGKTTTVTLLFDLFKRLNQKVGLLSTVENRINDEVINSTHTTPNAIALNGLLAEMVEKGCEFCFMEVSSHAVSQNRIAGLNFNIAVFSNITRDHLDYHKTFNDYIKAKKAFFDDLNEDAIALINVDDKHGRTMVQNTKAEIKTYGIHSYADFKGRVIENSFDGLHLQIENKDVFTQLIGSFNAYNVMAVYGVASILNVDDITALAGISTLTSVNGRFDFNISKNQVITIVDYAHTPDALENVLSTIKDVRNGNETLYTVIGCGGDRDKGKRPLMAKIAVQYSDKVILTSDNPRSEDPVEIINEMKAGIDLTESMKTLAIPDRMEAIKTACLNAKPNDIILVAGKGHETYQEVKGVKYDFDDKQVLKQIFNLLEK